MNPQCLFFQVPNQDKEESGRICLPLHSKHSLAPNSPIPLHLVDAQQLLGGFCPQALQQGHRVRCTATTGICNPATISREGPGRSKVLKASRKMRIEEPSVQPQTGPLYMRCSLCPSPPSGAGNGTYTVRTS